jgi:hypothetical protein
MSLRNRVLVLAVALCAVLPSGCMQAVLGRNPAVFDHLTEIPDLRDAVPSSPYHPQTTPPVIVSQPSSVKPEPRPPSTEPPSLVGHETPPKEIQPLPDLPTTSVARAAPEPPEEPIVQALRSYLLNKPAGAKEAMKLLQKYPRANQEMMLLTLPLLARMTEGNVDKLSPVEADELAKQVRRLEDMLRERAALSVDDLCFCNTIDSYGQVEVHPPEFRGGSGDQVGDRARVYIPLRNVVNKPNPAGSGYVTWLVGEAQVRKYDPNALFDNKLSCKLDDIKPQRLVSPSQRHEYFLAYGFWIPKGLPPGKYQLWIQVKDVTDQMTEGDDNRPASFNVKPHRVAEKTILFEVKDPNLTVRGSSPSDEDK